MTQVSCLHVYTTKYSEMESLQALIKILGKFTLLPRNHILSIRYFRRDRQTPKFEGYDDTYQVGPPH